MLMKKKSNRFNWIIPFHGFDIVNELLVLPLQPKRNWMIVIFVRLTLFLRTNGMDPLKDHYIVIEF